MPGRRRKYFPGLSKDERQAAVEQHLRPWVAQLRAWRAKERPSSHGPWFPLDRAMQALNELAEALTGEPLWRPAQAHSTPASGVRDAVSPDPARSAPSGPPPAPPPAPPR